MAESLKILAQLKPISSTTTLLYTVPANTIASISSVTICNMSASMTSFRISVAPSGAALSDEQYVYYDQPLEGNQTFVQTIGITLQQSDVIRVHSSSSDLSFNVFGVEVS